ncbi:MAG: lytic transglycosylase domain-containing protein [Desulfosarcina sp.]|nr:lytic transglycosylase domain-containing protein [Desulfosarcina sp.]
MLQKTSMTIDAYLRNAGLKPVGTTDPKQFIPLKTGPNPSFSADLASVTSSIQPESIGKKTGLTIADYLMQASTGASRGFCRDSAIQDGSLDPGRPDRSGHAFVPSNDEHTPPAPASRVGSASADTGADTPLDGEALIGDSIKGAARRYNLPEKLIAGVIQAESNFQVDAVSPAGAQGLMQLMPATARELGVVDPFDVRQNIDGGAAYLRRMLDRFGGDVRLALAAYNAGPGTVEKYNGNVPYRETQNYIERVLKRVSA